jgi:hypothetical protein
MPTNISPATATDITALDFNETIDTSGAPQELTLVPACAGLAFNSVWWKYTPPVGVHFVFWSANVTALSDVGYNPYSQVWVSDGMGGYTELEISGEPYCESLANVPDDPYYFRVPVTAGTTYWFQVVSPSNIAANGWLEVELLNSVSGAVPIRSIIVNDDEPGFPAAFIDKDTGAFLEYLAEYIAGEFADSIDGVGYAIADNDDGERVVLTDDQFVQYAEQSFAGETVIGIKSNCTDAYFILTSSGGGRNVHKIDASDASILDSWSLPSDFNSVRGYAVERDGSKLYAWVVNSTAAPTYVYNLDTSTQEANLNAGIAGEQYRGPGDGYIDVNGVLIQFSQLVANPQTGRIIGRNTTTGAEDFSHTITGSRQINHSARVSDSPNKVAIWYYLTQLQQALAQFTYFDLDTGLPDEDVSDIPVVGTSSGSSGPGDPNAISNSCPLLIAIAPVSPPVATGRIVVGKVTSPDAGAHQFHFTAGGGLSPSSFTLLMDEEQEFNDLAPGTYSIVELPDPDWTPTYFVSNDPNNDNLNIVVAAGDDITVMVLNTFLAQGGGIYVIHLTGPESGNAPPPGSGKTNDDFLQQAPGSGINTKVKIPDPFFITAFITDKQ